MITRIYVDNYRCFSNFEYAPGALQLLMGANGTGKTAVFDVLETLRDFIVEGTTTSVAFPPDSTTAWDRRPGQLFELSLEGNGGEYVYRLVIEQDAGARRNRISSEDLSFDRKALYQFQAGEAHLFRDDGTAGPVFPFDWSRSAIPTIPARPENTRLSWFRERLSRILVLSPDPSRMNPESREERPTPDRGLRDLVSWIRHLHLESPDFPRRLAESLRHDVLGGLVNYKLVNQGEGTRALQFEFGSPASELGERFHSYLLGLDQLSTGQRNLVALYTILHAAVGQDLTLCIDEPDNYVALREIQPWLVELTDKVRDTGGQCLLISHHPELINYLAPDCGIRFFREGSGPVRVQPFEWSEDEALRPAEVVARGWETP